MLDTEWESLGHPCKSLSHHDHYNMKITEKATGAKETYRKNQRVL